MSKSTEKKPEKIAAMDTGMTPRQLHFARAVASGMSQSDAYREAYNVREGSLTKTHNEKASRLMAQDNIRTRVSALIAAREAAVAAAAVGDRERAMRRIRLLTDEATGAPGEANMLRAAELLGRSVGLFKDVVLDHTPRDPAEVRQELEARLALAEEQAKQDAGIPVPVSADGPTVESSVH